MDFVDETLGWAVGKDAVRTTDGGENWQLMPVPDDLAGWDVSFVDRNTGWMIGRNGYVARTTDGGQSWNEKSVEAATSLQGLTVTSAD